MKGPGDLKMPPSSYIYLALVQRCSQLHIFHSSSEAKLENLGAHFHDTYTWWYILGKPFPVLLLLVNT
ncbi:hypothetical protein PGT21_024656 [Puccinia graminis f. sp. tritici]|uniref:Uncharacterized protein n=1 Tax=Puccinia graminis f. sp. tritici TaxID=56615 RepID=A0A5B0M970_PUCGR|nr:hypothetical protein PGT21_024656 [Puccinia graminis f. sp. tritici]